MPALSLRLAGGRLVSAVSASTRAWSSAAMPSAASGTTMAAMRPRLAPASSSSASASAATAPATAAAVVRGMRAMQQRLAQAPSSASLPRPSSSSSISSTRQPPALPSDTHPEPDRALFAQVHALGQQASPVFIMGLHRSGTTWLYDLLSSSGEFAWLSVYDVVHYGELLTAHAEGRTQKLQQQVDAHFASRGARSRGFDEVPLAHSTREEYGFVLRHWGASLSTLDSTSLPRFQEMVGKLSLLQGHRTVLMKNPWDTRQASFIAEAIPNARFVWIKREPIQVLDSQTRMYLAFARHGNPLLERLFAQSKLALERGILSVFSSAVKLLGVETFTSRLLLPFVERLVVGELQHYREQRAKVPADRQVEISYEDLVANPARELGRVFSFLDMTPTKPLDAAKASPRERPLLPAVEARAKDFRSKARETMMTLA